MSRLIVLDTGPLGLLTNPRATPVSVACREWMIKRLAASNVVVATVNVGHIAQFVAADIWQNI